VPNLVHLGPAIASTLLTPERKKGKKANQRKSIILPKFWKILFFSQKRQYNYNFKLSWFGQDNQASINWHS